MSFGYESFKDFAFFEIASDMFAYIQVAGDFVPLNPAWEQTLGFTQEELQNRQWLELVHPDDRQANLTKL